MRRTTIILLMVLIVVIAGGGVYWWLNKDTISSLLSGEKNINQGTTNTPVAVINSSPDLSNVNYSLPVPIQGDTAMDATLSVNGAQLHFSSLQKTATFDSNPAPAGQTYLLIYFDGLEAADAEKIQPLIRNETQLVTSQGVVKIGAYKIALKLIANDRGYLRFTISDKITKPELQIGSGAAVAKATIPI